jgi:hypothetical protein
MTYQLAAQLAAAKLNVDCARMDSSCVASAIAQLTPGYARMR